MSKITFIEPFKEGFFGAFSLAAAIIAAVVAVAITFASGGDVSSRKGSDMHHT